jgi:hypothetical protein
MLAPKDVPYFLWDEAVNHAVYLRNRTYVSALPNMTPYKAYFGKKPTVAHLKEWGSNVWILDESAGRSKLSLRANKMLFVGFVDGSRRTLDYRGGRSDTKTAKSGA